MRTPASDFDTPEARKAAHHLGRLVREARLARRMPQTELAARARTSEATVIRIEKGGVETALGIWLRIMEQLGLLHHVTAIKDPTSAALLDQHKARRARRNVPKDLDF